MQSGTIERKIGIRERRRESRKGVLKMVSSGVMYALSSF